MEWSGLTRWGAPGSWLSRSGWTEAGWIPARGGHVRMRLLAALHLQDSVEHGSPVIGRIGRASWLQLQLRCSRHLARALLCSREGSPGRPHGRDTCYNSASILSNRMDPGAG